MVVPEKPPSIGGYVVLPSPTLKVCGWPNFSFWARRRLSPPSKCPARRALLARQQRGHVPAALKVGGWPNFSSGARRRLCASRHQSLHR